MPSLTGSALYSNAKGQGWIRTILPDAWGELCTALGVKSGVVVLKAEEDDSFYESASCGYEEDGFYYSFLARGETGWHQIQEAEKPVRFMGSDYNLFHPEGVASVIRIMGQSEFIGFLLVEWNEEKAQSLEPILFLFAEKISREFEAHSKGNQVAILPVISHVSNSPSVLSLLPSVLQKIEKLKEQKIISIFGAAGSGKKTLAKFLHQQTRPFAPCLFLASVPENLGKLEKAVRDWSVSAYAGTIVFLGAKKWSLGQQKIVTDWLVEEPFQGQIFFLDNNDETIELIPEFAKILRKNPVQIPSFDYIEKADLKKIALILFSELTLEQNRNGLEISQEAMDVVIERNYPSNYTELKNLLLAAILKCKGNLIRAEDLGKETSLQNVGLPDAEDLDLPRGIQALEREKILNATRIFSGNQIRMAKALKISRGALQYKMKQLGLL